MLEFIQFIWKHRKVLVKINLPVAVLSVVISLLLPKWYESSLTFMIESGDTSSFLSNILGNIPLAVFPGLSTPADKFIAILGSRSVLDEVIEKFDLHEEYKSKYKEDTYEALMNNANFIDNEDGTVTISCMFKKNPQKAAEMANFFFDNLVKVSTRLTQERARRFKSYMQLGLDKALEELASAEDSLNLFQKEFGIISVEEQTRVLIEQIATLEIRRISKEIEKEFLLSMHEENHPEVKSVSKNIEILSGKIESLKKSSDYSNIPFEALPDMGLGYYRLFRDVQIRQKVIEFLVPQVEQAKIEENKTVTNLVILDRAIPFERKVKPKRSIFCILLTSISLLLSVSYYWFKDRHGLSREKLKELFPSTE